MDSTNSAGTQVKKETKNKIRVDYEGKLSLKDRIKAKFKSSYTWIKIIVNIFRFVLMVGVCFVIIYPFIARITASFMSFEDILDKTVSLIPKNPTLEIYEALIVDNRYFEAFANTLLLSLSCALIQMLVSCLVGYGLAKFKFKGNKLIMALVVVTMIVPHSALRFAMADNFGQFDFFRILTFDTVGLIELITGSPINMSNTYAPLIILSLGGLAFKNGLYIYLMRQFFKGVPDELEESAYVDGSGTIRTFFQIILPLAVPMMITVFLFSFSWQWTDDFYTKIFFVAGDGSPNKIYLMPDVYSVVTTRLNLPAGTTGKAMYDNVIQNTGGMLIIAPLIIIYLFCQKFLVQGIERSGITG